MNSSKPLGSLMITGELRSLDERPMCRVCYAEDATDFDGSEPIGDACLEVLTGLREAIEVASD